MQEVFSQPHLGAFLLRKKLRRVGGSGRKSASRIYFWSFAVGKTPHWIQAPLQSLAQIPAPQEVDIIPMIDSLATDFADFELIFFGLKYYKVALSTPT
jgi:hypothetical protein